MKKLSLMLLIPFTLTACVKQQTATVAPPATSLDNVSSEFPDIYQSSPEVVRYDRYLLVDTSPEIAQRYPLKQVVQLRMPNSLKPTVTVGEAMRYALRQSGYRLCSVSGQVNTLYQQSLPAPHYQLGPVQLNVALQLLAGAAWKLDVDDVQRVVCHSLRPKYQWQVADTAPSNSTPLVDIKQTFEKRENKGGWLEK
ncbi:conjugal transfer protein [Xenorhabdus griffiniae]|uniref:Conjugal transfer protein n=1 Tax=Xenorhabdus griffiniae TaxID=351672 RepID=A0ABY9XEX2_9GAMM|nr:conjugal transfer protein [Xenorhabdus griffiniae]MBD1225982.1 conjugal transfer protein [Xenorhabdus griffiniae]MBE8585900.1 conjugal transfer protein [Xenorhabdus griffiniae]WMV71444.1 conjugal transfer protein [Xenorhabdus griffiniae]WNH01121.1 conjugal transfer protein [Xenorhabdus griffiniae]